MRNLSIAVMAFALAIVIAPEWAQKTNGGEEAEAAAAAKNAPRLAGALKEAKISLQEGLKASEGQGQPISGKFEIEDGKLQLSVYTVKDGKFFEVIVDHKTGQIAKAEPVTEKDDIADAKKQASAMLQAKGTVAGYSVEKGQTI